MISVEVGKRVQIPPNLKPYISDTTYKNFILECYNCPNEDEFHNVIARYNSIQNWQGAVTGEWVGYCGAKSLICCRYLQFGVLTFNTKQLGTGQYYITNQANLVTTSTAGYITNSPTKARESLYYNGPVTDSAPVVNYYSAVKRPSIVPSTGSTNISSNANVRTVVPITDTPVEVVAYRVVDTN